jgi:hypothetical protein
MASAISGNLGLTVDYLVVAGGAGGGAGNSGGGGGAGGYRTSIGGTSLSLALNTSFTVTVGAGGAIETNGANSVFSTITSSGGGKGGTNISGTTGGSAGGASGNPDGTTAGTAGNSGGYSPAEGTAGGSAFGASADRNAGGGGGATSAGSNGVTGAAGAGGAGTSNSISGSSVTYAGGGGGGTPSRTPAGAGGAGGGGAGGSSTDAAIAGTVNRGAGGGGGGDSVAGKVGAAGGSGVVIARYSGTTQKAYGGTVTTSGGNTIHTFTSSGNFYTVFAPPVSGYSLWLDAADASTFTFSSGTVVSQWNDKSGSARNFTQATVGNQPTRNVTQNGLPGLTFNADFMANTGFNWANSAFTTFVVIKYDSAANNFTGVLGSNISSGPALAISSDDAFAIFKIGVTPFAYNLFPTSSNADVAVWKAPGVTSGSLTTTFYKNGTQASSTTTVTGLSTGTGAVLGASTTGGADLTPPFDYTFVYEVLVYPSQLSDTDRNLVEGYLKTKWGTP